jgi:excisionase family DNA binding protein
MILRELLEFIVRLSRIFLKVAISRAKELSKRSKSTELTLKKVIQMNERFLTLKQVADYLGIKLSAVYQMSHAGKLPGKCRFGLGEKPRNVRVDKLKLDEWIESQTEAVK